MIYNPRDNQVERGLNKLGPQTKEIIDYIKNQNLQNYPKKFVSYLMSIGKERLISIIEENSKFTNLKVYVPLITLFFFIIINQLKSEGGNVLDINQTISIFRALQQKNNVLINKDDLSNLRNKILVLDTTKKIPTEVLKERLKDYLNQIEVQFEDYKEKNNPIGFGKYIIDFVFDGKSYILEVSPDINGNLTINIIIRNKLLTFDIKDLENLMSLLVNSNIDGAIPKVDYTPVNTIALKPDSITEDDITELLSEIDIAISGKRYSEANKQPNHLRLEKADLTMLKNENGEIIAGLRLSLVPKIGKNPPYIVEVYKSPAGNVITGYYVNGPKKTLFTKSGTIKDIYDTVIEPHLKGIKLGDYDPDNLIYNGTITDISSLMKFISNGQLKPQQLLQVVIKRELGFEYFTVMIDSKDGSPTILYKEEIIHKPEINNFLSSQGESSEITEARLINFPNINNNLPATGPDFTTIVPKKVPGRTITEVFNNSESAGDSKRMVKLILNLSNLVGTNGSDFTLNYIKTYADPWHIGISISNESGDRETFELNKNEDGSLAIKRTTDNKSDIASIDSKRAQELLKLFNKHSLLLG